MRGSGKIRRIAAYIAGMTRMRDAPGPAFMKMHGAGNDFVIIDSRGRGAVATPALARRSATATAAWALTSWPRFAIRMGCRFRAGLLEQRRQPRRGLRQCHALRGRSVMRDSWAATGVLPHRARAAAGRTAGRRAGQREHGPAAAGLGNRVPLAACRPLHLPLPGDPVAVGMGNPHCVIFVPDAEAVDLPALGPRYEHDPLFPRRPMSNSPA
jgi:diaminopimelate epimerase